MAQDPLRPRDNGQMRMPRPDVAMNKIAPRFGLPDKKGTMLGYPTEADSKEKTLETMRKRMEQVISAEAENRKSGLDDKMFLAGNQWPTEVMAQRNLDKRPCLTINKLPTFVMQVVNGQRENRPSINVSPTGDMGDPDVAKMYRGLIRFIERDCHADGSYDTAFDDAVTMGWGYFRIVTDYEAPDTFDQIIQIKRVRNAFTVYMDPMAQDPTGADAKWCFISDMIPREEFRSRWPDAVEVPYNDGGIGEKYQSWATKDEIRIVEYFEVKTEKRTLVKLSNGHVGWKDELDEITNAYIKRRRLFIEEERESEVPTVMWYKATAVDILEESEWIGSTIPVVRVIGNSIDIEGKVKWSGLIRHAKDPQRMYNYWRPLSLETPLPTPTGWTTMGATQVGDWLLDDKGKPTRIVGMSPVHLHRDCYRVKFDDGTEIVADADHPWAVEERKGTGGNSEWFPKVIRTVDLVPKKHIVPTVKPLELDEATLPVNPYLLGVWLGDGTTTASQITVGQKDAAAIRANLLAEGCNVGVMRPQGVNPQVSDFTVHGVRSAFSASGLLGNKHIPPAYLRASRAQREALFQGLMDTDGSVSASSSGQCGFTTTLPRLAADFSELLRTLGIKFTCTKRAGRLTMFSNGIESQGRDSYQFAFRTGPGERVFRIGRKQQIVDRPRARHTRRTKRFRIISVTAVPSVPVKCVAIDSPSHLFLAGEGMIPTHNTAETELIALQPKAPWVMEEGQGEGHEDEWKSSNVRNIPVLYYKGTSIGNTPAPPPQRQPMAGVPAGVVQAATEAAQDMQATTGVRFDASQNERMIDESGKAIRELRRAGDIGAFHYVDNLAQSLRRCGEILVEIIPKVYNERRVVTILREDDQEEQVRIDPNHMKATGQEQKRDGKIRRLFNPSYGKYGVTVTIGPSYATKRIEATENMMQFMRALPQTAALVADLFVKNSDWPGAEEIAARLAKTLPPGLVTPDMKDVSPQIQAVMQQQENAIKQLSEQLKASMAALQDKNADRAIDQDKIQKTFEVALLKIVADTETKMAKIQESAVANVNTHLTAQMEALGKGAGDLAKSVEKSMEAANDEGGDETPPPEAMQHLKPGRHTRFANGSTWTMGDDGVPTKVGDQKK